MYAFYFLKETVDFYCLRWSDDEPRKREEKKESAMRTRCIAMFVVKAD